MSQILNRFLVNATGEGFGFFQSPTKDNIKDSSYCSKLGIDGSFDSVDDFIQAVNEKFRNSGLSSFTPFDSPILFAVLSSWFQEGFEETIKSLDSAFLETKNDWGRESVLFKVTKEVGRGKSKKEVEEEGIAIKDALKEVSKDKQWRKKFLSSFYKHRLKKYLSEEALNKEDVFGFLSEVTKNNYYN